MAILLYNNGILEELKPNQLVFTEDELLNVFSEFRNIRSKRLMEIPNTWCIWGEMDNPDPIEFNRLCTDILEIYVFSPVVFIHDSEIDPKWGMTDMLYKSYPDFRTDLNMFIDEMAKRLVEETDNMVAQHGTNNMILLTTVGQTDDKHVIYAFNPTEQSEDFYKDDSFAVFSDKIAEYLKDNAKMSEHLVIFSDKKVIITVEKNNVPTLFHKMLKIFESKENYEMCADLTHIFNDWKGYTEKMNQKKKRGRPKKNKEDLMDK